MKVKTKYPWKFLVGLLIVGAIVSLLGFKQDWENILDMLFVFVWTIAGGYSLSCLYSGIRYGEVEYHTLDNKYVDSLVFIYVTIALTNDFYSENVYVFTYKALCVASYYVNYVYGWYMSKGETYEN